MHRGQDGKYPPGVLVKGSHSRVGGKTVGDAGDAGRKGPVDGDSKKTLMQRLEQAARDGSDLLSAFERDWLSYALDLKQTKGRRFCRRQARGEGLIRRLYIELRPPLS